MLASLATKVSLLSVSDAAYGVVLRPTCPLTLGLHQKRWKSLRLRKPRWMPIAPSKLYNIIEHPAHDPEEKMQIIHLYNIYHTEIKSLSKYFMDEHKRALEEADKNSAISQEEVREQERLLEENERENQRVAKLREERRKQLMEQRVEELLRKEADAQRELEERKKLIEEIVRNEKAQSDSYITLEKLDDAINFALENPVSYNYAIDLDGNQVWEGTPHFEVQFHKPQTSNVAA